MKNFGYSLLIDLEYVYLKKIKIIMITLVANKLLPKYFMYILTVLARIKDSL